LFSPDGEAGAPRFAKRGCASSAAHSVRHRKNVLNMLSSIQADVVQVLLPDSQSSKELAHEKNTKAPEGTTTGVAAGIGALAIPGVGPFIAAGPIIAALAGMGFGGAVGGLIGALVGMGIPEYEAKRYEGRIKDGGILLSAHRDTSDEIERAKNILKATGAEDISSTGESSADFPAKEPVRRTTVLVVAESRAEYLPTHVHSLSPSVMRIIRFTGKLSKRCFSPLGHQTSKACTSVWSANPKCC